LSLPAWLALKKEDPLRRPRRRPLPSKTL